MDSTFTLKSNSTLIFFMVLRLPPTLMFLAQFAEQIPLLIYRRECWSAMQRSNLTGTPSRPVSGELLISNSIFCS